MSEWTYVRAMNTEYYSLRNECGTEIAFVARNPLEHKDASYRAYKRSDTCWDFIGAYSNLIVAKAALMMLT